MSSFIKGFFDINRRLCERVEARLPADFLINLHRSYEAAASQALNTNKNWTVLDIGAGRNCPYMRFLKADRGHRIVAIDVDEDELRHNAAVSFRVVADAVKSLPVSDRSVDFISARSVMEHISDTRRYMRNCANALKPGGYVIQSFPCRFAPFAALNRILPNRLARALLHYLYPEWRVDCGFRAFYDNCYPSAMQRILEENNLEIVHSELRYYEAIYYTFFLPLYVVMVAYDLIAWRIGVKNLACQMLFVARKKAATVTSIPDERMSHETTSA
ncbi:MAG TPA: class I SAM-dependent methyltransferase [Candidatus Cybelea sp.]|nr:class I SAM-dependent methyltransferase [Candidatus Cybelea sp.]